jgi:hemerythrin-like domain-containing protein
MTATGEAPADTTMMRIVHDALRRDVARARAALAGPARTHPAQRRAIGAHLAWMMQFLHVHHSMEDDGLYPLVRERAEGDRDALAVIESMGRAHEEMLAAIADVDDAANALTTGDPDALEPAVEALTRLAEVLLPHLQEEEDEAMPIVSRLITVAEWQAIEKPKVESKSMTELGFEGHWLIDGASDADRAVVLSLVPPVPRFILLHGFAHRYRQHAAACWGDDVKPPVRIPMNGRAAVSVEADIDEVWDVVRDVTRVGEWSHECVGAEWLDGASDARPGARFRGRNRAGLFKWGRVCEVLRSEPYELVWATVPSARYPDSTEWRIALDKVDGGTQIVQEYRVVKAPKVLGALYALVIPAHRDRTEALADDLRRIGTVAGQAQDVAVTTT